MENLLATRISLLRCVSIFANPDEQVLSKIAAVLEEIHLADGEQLFQMGDAGDALYIIRQGKIKIHDKDYVFNVLESGQIFGEYSLLDDKERSASATSLGESFVYQLTRGDFYDFAKRYPDIKEGVLKLLIGRLRDWNVLEEELARKNTEITEQKDEIEKQRDEIKEQKIMKDKLFSIISHDLRGPVTAFSGLCDIIKWLIESESFEELLEMIEDINREAAQLESLLDNLLNYASQELSQIPYKPEQVNLAELVEHLTQSVSFAASSKHIELVSEVDQFQEIWADRNSTEIILRNLIGNALKFTPEHGSITVSASQDNRQFRINVRDTGVGMSADKVKQLFKLDAKSTYGTKGEKGVGLGLQLVAEFTKLNKGEIHVSSEKGVGTTFTISLPAAVHN
jgi:signal transduction histidine kinase